VIAPVSISPPNSASRFFKPVGSRSAFSFLRSATIKTPSVFPISDQVWHSLFLLPPIGAAFNFSSKASASGFFGYFLYSIKLLMLYFPSIFVLGQGILLN
jgi:hypothetical protein